jgi:hypothetical protein
MKKEYGNSDSVCSYLFGFEHKIADQVYVCAGKDPSSMMELLA